MAEPRNYTQEEWDAREKTYQKGMGEKVDEFKSKLAKAEQATQLWGWLEANPKVVDAMKRAYAGELEAPSKEDEEEPDERREEPIPKNYRSFVNEKVRALEEELEKERAHRELDRQEHLLRKKYGHLDDDDIDKVNSYIADNGMHGSYEDTAVAALRDRLTKAPEGGSPETPPQGARIPESALPFASLGGGGGAPPPGPLPPTDMTAEQAIDKARQDYMRAIAR